MRRIFLLALGLVLFHSGSVQADHGTFGLGAVIGDPTAITGKYWLDHEHALDMGLSFFESNYFFEEK